MAVKDTSELFTNKLTRRIKAINSILCVGLDPHRTDLIQFAERRQLSCAALLATTSYTSETDKIPDAERVKTSENGHVIDGRATVEIDTVAYQFCKYLIDETKDYAAAYKPNSAFFEALGDKGFQTLKKVVTYIKALPTTESTPQPLVIVDCKRGDIASTAAAYAAAVYDYLQADAVTIHPYLGFDSITPFITDQYKTKFAFVLVKTSNPSADTFQKQVVRDSHSLQYFEHVAKTLSAQQGSTMTLGMVLGATDTESMRRARKQAPTLWILSPGVGFQGGNLDATVKNGLAAAHEQAAIGPNSGLGLLVPVSRGIARAENVKEKAKELRDALNAAITRANQPGSVASTELLSQDTEDTRNESTFFQLCLDCGVLKFGEFTLKSGRKSPYFFNAGLFSTGAALSALADCYADVIQTSGVKFDVLFGPAYKGIPLVTAIAISLSKAEQQHATTPAAQIEFAYDRKEPKDHGEGGVLVGADVRGKRVLIVDDVITSGLAISKSIAVLKKHDANIVGVCIALDRQESKNFQLDVDGVKLMSVGNLTKLVAFLQRAGEQVCSAEDKVRMQQYREQYGAL